MADAIPSETPSSQSQDEAEGVRSSGDGSHPQASQQRAAADSTERVEQAVEAGRSSSSGDDNAEGIQEGGDGNGDEEEGEEEEVGECGFCLFMKSGPCRDSFIKWEECVEQAEKDKEDIVDRCHQVTFLLKECMEKNSDYYEPVLQAERVLGEEAEAEAAAAAAAEAGEASKPDGEEWRSAPPPDSGKHPPVPLEKDQHLPEPVESVLPASVRHPSE